MKNIHLLPTDKPSRLCIDNSCDELNYCDVEGLNSKHITNQHIYITSDEDINENDHIITQDGRLAEVSYLLSKDLEDASKIILTTDLDLIKDGVQSIDDDFLEWFVKNPSCEEVDVMTDAFTVKEMSMLPLGTRNLKYKIIIPKEEPKQLFTDYPITELGDEEFKESPIRECELLSYDDNKYCYVKVEGIEKEIKRCYIYPQKGRFGEIDCVSIDEIKELLKKEPKQETLEEVADRLVNRPYGNVVSKSSFIEGAKWQAEKMGLMEIELKHTKTLLASCEKALEERDLQAERMYSEEEVQVKLYECLGHFAQKHNIIINGNEIDELFNQFKKK